jgi:predicted  nucleic acid-binding Zn-ribbon protein
MSQNNIPQTLPSVEKLLTRIAAAERSQQKEIRITIQEARDLTIELGILTARLGSTINEINQSLKRLENSSGNIEVKFDGGGFQ